MEQVTGDHGGIRTAIRRATARLSTLNRERRRRGWVIPARLRSSTVRLLLLLTGTLVGLGCALVWCFGYLNASSPGQEIGLRDLRLLSSEHRVESATLYDYDHRVVGLCVVDNVTCHAQTPNAATSAYWTDLPDSDVETPGVVAQLDAGGADLRVQRQSDKEIVHFVAQFVLPITMLANLFGLVFILGRSGGGSGLGGVIQFGRIGKRRAGRGAGHAITFGDVAGADETVAELREVRDYLADPARFIAMGAQPPKGVLLFGPPGCGKTLMARAVAGEAGVPFFSISGAEFVESLVGIGAARVRDLFRQVRQAAPAIVFIDELDAAGRRRGGVTGGQEEREQTLNQLLVEMDGFEPTTGIVVMGATNRPDILDPALLRPGRFDRQVTVEPPDIHGRQAILELHARSRPVAADADFEQLARRTPGFTGADLANVINEAALLTVRFGKTEIGMEELQEAVQRVLSGPRRRGHLLSADERKRAAYHEAGHALVAAAMGRLEEIQRITVIPRGRNLGEAMSSKAWQERILLSRRELRSEMVILMGGGAAEEMILGEPSSGADADLGRATSIAQIMVGRYGMSERLGKVRMVRLDGNEFLGGDMVPMELTSGPVLMELHQEVRRLIDEAERTASQVLARHRAVLIEVAERLEEQETLELGDLEMLLETLRPEMNVVVEAAGTVATNGSRVTAAFVPDHEGGA